MSPGLSTHGLAVVPIFVNAGAALLPAIIAGFTSLFAILASPRAMLSVCRRKPWIPVSIVVLAAGLWFLPRLIPAAPPPVAAPKTIDWSAVARAIENPHPILTPLWQSDLDGAMALSTPALHNDAHGNPILYVPTTLLDIGGKSGSLFAFNALTGKQLWIAGKDASQHDLKPFFSSPAISDDGAYLAVGQGLHDDFNSPLLCFDLRAAATPPPLAWSVPTPVHVESSPAIFTRGGEQYAVVGAGAIEGKDRLAIGNPGYVFCVALASGKQVWQQPVNDPESSPVVDESGNVYIGSGFNGNAVVALRSETDDLLHGQPRQLWKTATPYPATGDVSLASDPTLGKIVLIGIGNGDFVNADPVPKGAILALSCANGKILWQADLPDCVLGRITMTPDHTLLAPCKNGQAYALKLSNGQIIWHQQISAAPHIPILAGLATDGPHTFALAADGTLAVLDTATGQMLDTEKLSDEAKSPQNYSCSTPVFRDGILYVATETKGLQAFRIKR